MDSRETRDWAREIKFVTSLDKRSQIVDWARANLASDGHGAGVYADEYSTSTLYFETPDFDVYQQNKSYGRSKFRIRRYGTSNVIFLERKFRTERLLAKRRTTVPINDLERLSAKDADPAWPGFWFQRRILLRRLQPMIQLSYDRVARIGDSPTGPVRMTIDMNLNVLPMPDRAFIAGVGMRILDDRCIVEVKYRKQLPIIFKELSEKFGLEVQKVSKFRNGLRLLDYPLPTNDDEHVAQPLTEAHDSAAHAQGYWD